MIDGHDLNAFKDKRALITGGMGFLGSNLAIALTELGADVTIVDAMLPGYGGNLFNIQSIKDQVTINFCDIRDSHVMNYLVQKQDFIFHLAGQVDHVLSMSNPFPDIDINVTGTTVLMEACKLNNPLTRVIYTGTRGEYGPATSLPVNEDAPTNPKGIYEITNLAAEKILQFYYHTQNIHTVMLRLSNIYGPRAQMRHSRYGVANWFIRLAVDDDIIKVFGDGQIKRDFLYVEDCINAILLAAINDAAIGEVMNVGMDHPTNFVELATSVIDVAGTGSWEFAEFTAERKAQDPGDFYSDITKIRQLLDWEPKTTLIDGLKSTIDFYRKYREYYW